MSEGGAVLLYKSGGKQATVKFNVGEDYRLIQTIGTGAYGVVCSAIHSPTDQKVAIKKISNAFEMLMTAKRTLRELKLLLHFKHDNVVGVKDILHRESSDCKIQDVYVIMDLMESDLHHVIRSKQSLTEDHICYFMYQLLRGLKYIHSANVIHRDLKPSNLLVNENCELKIGDFGMARGIANTPEDNKNFMTEYVATRWYRAPELMLSMCEYSMAIDMWSVGCIFAEMLGRKQLFPGRHYVHQLQLIISVLGSPSSRVVGSIRSERVRSYVQRLPVKSAVPLKTLFPKASAAAIDLLSQFLQFDPTCRVSAAKALDNSFFQEYHDQDDEPLCPEPFDFRFESTSQNGGGPTKDSVKQQVLDLIKEYRLKRNRIKKQLIFLPKSQSESPAASADPAQDRNNNSSESREDAFFKKPAVVPFDKMSYRASPHGTSSSSNAIEMSSRDACGTQPESTDVTMHSAKSHESAAVSHGVIDKENDGVYEKSNDSRSSQESGRPNAKKTISETTKMLVRDTILASMLAKKNGLTRPSERTKKPVTAAERQKEREEKRRKRQEKAAEKERKKRETEGGKPTLSDQDKTLLERWSKMQQEKKEAQGKADGKSQTRQVTVSLSSPSSLTRQNSLPSLPTPRLRTQSNPITNAPTRRWSLNNDISFSYESGGQYVPTLSDILHSPMLITDGQNPSNASHYDALGSDRMNASQQSASVNQQSVQIRAQTPIVIQRFNGNGPNRVAGDSDARSSNPVYFQTNQNNVTGIQSNRPNTLGVHRFLNPTARTDGGNAQTGKSLVTLSPDTVDFVLNQHMHDEASPFGGLENIVSARQESAKDPEKDLTLSPGKTTLVVKVVQALRRKEDACGFSRGNFPLDFDKGSEGEDMRSKFLDAQNGSVMLSASAAANKKELLYVSSELSHNPLNKQQPEDLDVYRLPAQAESTAGGYGVGYEESSERIDAFGNSLNRTSALSEAHMYDMDCDSAKSSSSLLNEWLEVSRMGEHDIEQLQRELELGSPMCIDYNFKSD